MKDRILLLIKAKNMTAAQFADQIGVQKSSISHILSGRNNASLDFVQKILITFPEVSTEWLLFGKGPIFGSENSAGNPNNTREITPQEPLIQGPVDLFSGMTVALPSDFEPQNALSDPDEKEGEEEEMLGKPAERFSPDTIQTNVQTATAGRQADAVRIEKDTAPAGRTPARILKIVEFYRDGTFREFFPERSVPVEM
jgi:transcriptional regulator with XRE-family HTH domain